MAACSVCSKVHQVGEIDRRLLAGEAVAALAREFGCSRHALARHRDGGHAGPVAMVTVTDAGDLLPAATVDRVEALLRQAMDVLDRANRRGQTSTVLAALREARQQLELLAKLLGELSDRPQVQVNVLQLPEYLEHVSRVRRAIREAAPPDVAIAIAKRVAELADAPLEAA